MGFRDRFESMRAAHGDVRLLTSWFAGVDAYRHEGWTVAEITADQMIEFSAHPETTFVEDDGEGGQTWEFQGRNVLLRRDPDHEYRAYLEPFEGSLPE